MSKSTRAQIPKLLLPRATPLPIKQTAPLLLVKYLAVLVPSIPVRFILLVLAHGQFGLLVRFVVVRIILDSVLRFEVGYFGIGHVVFFLILVVVQYRHARSPTAALPPAILRGECLPLPAKLPAVNARPLRALLPPHVHFAQRRILLEAAFPCLEAALFECHFLEEEAIVCLSEGVEEAYGEEGYGEEVVVYVYYDSVEEGRRRWCGMRDLIRSIEMGILWYLSKLLVHHVICLLHWQIGRWRKCIAFMAGQSQQHCQHGVHNHRGSRDADSMDGRGSIYQSMKESQQALLVQCCYCYPYVRIGTCDVVIGVDGKK